MDRIASINLAMSYKDSPFVRVSKEEGVAIIDMDDQKSFNSLTRDFIFTLFHKMVDLSSQDDVKVILLQSQTKAFCSGGNIGEIGEFNLRERMRSDSLLYHKRLASQITKPVVAVVHGVAFGGGFELALFADIIIASRDAKFSFKEINLGIFPGLGGTMIAKTVGRYRAANLILTADTLTADQAKQLLIVSEVCKTRNDAHKRGLEVAKKIAGMSMYALIAAKKAIRISAEESGLLAIESESQLFSPLLDLPASKEGIGAFLAKRQPNFTGM
jgi:enoyl-CoA hydratase/carnithine racemase